MNAVRLLQKRTLTKRDTWRSIGQVLAYLVQATSRCRCLGIWQPQGAVHQADSDEFLGRYLPYRAGIRTASTIWWTSLSVLQTGCCLGLILWAC